MLLLAVGGDRFLSHHELRPSVGPVLNPYPHNGVYVCVCPHKAEVSAYACAYVCVVSSLCPVYFSSPATLRLPSTTLAILSQPTHTGRGVSRPVKSRSYRHSGRTDSTNRCCYECYQRLQCTEDNSEPSFLPGINSLWGIEGFVLKITSNDNNVNSQNGRLRHDIILI